jgi:glycerol-3-phosphate acyltransferase PlsY
VDLTTLGSRNIGATNAFRVMGPAWGGVVFALDVAKGAVAAHVPAALLLDLGMADPSRFLLLRLAGGVAAILGHTLSPWLRFRGGKGVATSLGVFFAVLPIATAVAFGLWILLFLVSRYRVSVASMGASVVYPFLVWFMRGDDSGRVALTGAAAAVSALVLVRHRENIRRILAGTERPIVEPRKGRER